MSINIQVHVEAGDEYRAATGGYRRAATQHLSYLIYDIKRSSLMSTRPRLKATTNTFTLYTLTRRQKVGIRMSGY